MNPIEIAKNRCPKIGLSETELKGALFFLAGINSFARLDADDSERNKLFDYSSVGPFEPDDELPNNVSERSGSIYREIINLFDEENRFGLYESSSSREHEIIKLPEPFLFEEFKNVDLKLGETHKLFIKISQEFGNLLENRSESDCYSDGALFWQQSIPIWQKSAAIVISAIGDSSPPWFMFLKSFPYGEKEFFLQSHPMQNIFHPFIQGFEQELAQCEWAYTSWICFDDGEMIEDTLRCKPEEFFGHSLYRMEGFKSHLDDQTRQLMISLLPQNFINNLHSSYSVDQNIFEFVLNFVEDFFHLNVKCGENGSPLHLKLMWQCCVAHIIFSICLRFDFDLD